MFNEELEIVRKRINNVGYKLYTYNDVFEILKSDSDYINEEIEVFVFKTGKEYSFSESLLTVCEYDSVDSLRKDVEINTIKSKTYKREKAWGKKLYDFSKLNNFVYTFVIIN